jgi:hypothetical protein
MQSLEASLLERFTNLTNCPPGGDNLSLMIPDNVQHQKANQSQARAQA